jgi:ribosomal protein S18 acetylase RimI-like enzyme
MTTAPPDRRDAGATPTAADVTVRRATPADAGTVQTLVLEIARHEGCLDHVHVTRDSWVELLDRGDVIVLLAERAGHALGYTSAVRRLHLWSGQDVLAVDDVYVRAGERSAGVGRRLLTAMATFAHPDDLTLTWGVEPENTRAQWFYVRLGATLHDKVLARWTPDAYRQLLVTGTEADR